MCGLAGIVAFSERYRIARAWLEAMSARLAHRGPDGQGLYLNHERAITPAAPQCGLVHRRLAILDLRERALQPMEDASGQQWLVFNGEIYNFRQLREQLDRANPGMCWKTSGDTEVLLRAWRQWGEGCLEKLNGMFAFAIWDQSRGQLFLARDRMGQKPLYYAVMLDNGQVWSGEAGGGAQLPAGRQVQAVAFASELTALRQVPWIHTQIDMLSLSDYLCWGYVPAPRTIYSGARKLTAASWLRIDGRQVELRRYYDPNSPSPGQAEMELPQAVASTRNLINQAVSRQLVSDVPVGLFLSGGMDSSIIAAAMKTAAPDQPIHSFSIGFDDPRYDETACARRVAEHLGTRHEQFTVRIEAAADLPRLAQAFGEPFADSSALPTHYLSRQTGLGVKVALSGDGGDELFGGYDRYRAMLLSHRMRRWPTPLRQVARSGLWQWLPGSHPKGRLTRLKRLLGSLGEPAPRRYSTYMRLFETRQIFALLGGRVGRELQISGNWLGERYAQFLGQRDVVEAALAVDRISYLPDDLLTKVDRCSMLHALEVRSPFMDHDLVNFAAALPQPMLLEGGSKRLLRLAYGDALPAEVFARRKMGFAVPLGEWFAGELRDMGLDLIESAGSFTRSYLELPAARELFHRHLRPHDHGQRLYALLMLELWWKNQDGSSL